jgi:hypothetical protein
MGADTLHSDYQENIKLWLKCRHFVEGTESVKKHSETYLPRLEGQEDSEYGGYLMRAAFYPAAHRSVQGLAGAVMKKVPFIKFPDMEYLKDIGVDNESIQQIATKSLEEDLTTGRIGGYVDADPDGGKAYIALYNAESVLNWKKAVIDGREQPTMICLREKINVPDPDGDEFEMLPTDQIRVLRLEDDLDLGLIYTVQVYTRKEQDDDAEIAKQNVDNLPNGDYEPGEKVIPRMKGGKPLNFIPFRFCSIMGSSDVVTKSPIQDLVDMNHNHYLTSADLEHGAHYTALPTAYAFGFDPKNTKLHIGSSRAWVSEKETAKAGFIEFTGAGLGFLQNLLKDKEAKMAVLGARLLEEQKNSPESGTALELRHAGEKSVLSNIATSVSEFLTDLLEWIVQWEQMSGEATITLNQNFGVVTMDAQTLAQMMLGVQQGLISWKVWFYNLKNAEIIPDEVTEDEEKEALSEGLPMPKLNPSDPANAPKPVASGTNILPAKTKTKPKAAKTKKSVSASAV